VQSSTTDDVISGRRRERHESDNSVRSLPADLERMAAIDECNVSKQAPNQITREVYVTRDDDGHIRTSSSGSEDAFVAGVGSSSTRCNTFEMGAVGGSSDSVYEPVLAGSRNGSTGSEKMQQQMAKIEAIKLQPKEEIREQRNKTMLIQVGGKELLLISLDRKSVIFERQFKDISFCSQVCSLYSHLYLVGSFVLLICGLGLSFILSSPEHTVWS